MWSIPWGAVHGLRTVVASQAFALFCNFSVTRTNELSVCLYEHVFFYRPSDLRMLLLAKQGQLAPECLSL